MICLGTHLINQGRAGDPLFDKYYFTLYCNNDLHLNTGMCLDVQSCPTLSNLVHYSLPGSSVHGISQARMLEWVAIS